MSDIPPPHQSQEPESDSDRRLGNIVLAVGLVALLGIAWWLADALYTARRADDCISSGRRSCTPVDVPIRER